MIKLQLVAVEDMENALRILHHISPSSAKLMKSCYYGSLKVVVSLPFYYIFPLVKLSFAHHLSSLVIPTLLFLEGALSSIIEAAIEIHRTPKITIPPIIMAATNPKYQIRDPTKLNTEIIPIARSRAARKGFIRSP
jgi:hypothetical protein